MLSEEVVEHGTELLKDPQEDGQFARGGAAPLLAALKRGARCFARQVLAA